MTDNKDTLLTTIKTLKEIFEELSVPSKSPNPNPSPGNNTNELLLIFSSLSRDWKDKVLKASATHSIEEVLFAMKDLGQLDLNKRTILQYVLLENLRARLNSGEIKMDSSILSLAVKYSDTDLISFALSGEISETEINKHHSDIWKIACAQGSDILVKKLLSDSRFNVKKESSYLVESTMRTNFPLAKILIEDGRALISSETMRNLVKKNDIELVKRLIKRSLNEVNGSMEFLAACCRHNSLELVKFLLETYKDFSPNWYNPISASCTIGNPEMLKILLDRFDPGAFSNDCVVVCVENERADCLEILLKDKRVSPGKKHQALKLACQKGNTRIIKLLLDDERTDAVSKNNSIRNIVTSKNLQDVVTLFTEHPTYKIHNLVRAGDLDSLKKYFAENGVSPARGQDRALRTACASNKPEIVQFLLSDPRVSVVSKNYAALHKAVKLGYTNIVKLLLSRNDIKPKDRQDILTTAITNNHEEVVKILINDDRIHFDVTYGYYSSHLRRSIECPNPEIFNCVINRKNFLPSKASTNWPDLFEPRRMGHFKYLVQHPKLVPQVHEASFFPAAVKAGEEFLDILLKDTRFNPSTDKNAALTAAISHNLTQIALKLLRDPRIDPSIGSVPPIVSAITHRNWEIARAILSHQKSVDPSVKLNFAIQNCDDLETVKMLLADPRVDPAADGNAALKAACTKGNFGVFTALLSNPKVDPTDPSVFSAACSGKSIDVFRALLTSPKIDPSLEENIAIITAVKNGNSDIVRELLQDKRVDPSARGNLAIMIACHKGYTKIVKNLLSDSRVDPSVSNNYAVRKSARNGFSEILEILLSDNRVNPNASNFSALRHAMKNGHTTCVEMLQKVAGKTDIVITKACEETTALSNTISKAISDNKCTRTITENPIFQPAMDFTICKSCAIVCMNKNSKFEDEYFYEYVVCACSSENPECPCFIKKNSNRKFHENFPIFISPDPISPVRREFQISNENKIIEIDQLLTPAECKFYIQEAEKLEFQSVASEYERDYRDCDRVLVKSQEFSEMLWKRIARIFQKNDIENIRPFGFWNEGTWKPVGVNPVIRFTRYKPGGHFSIHRDGMYVQDSELRSIFTLLIYLNEEFTEGHTSFFTEESKWLWLAKNQDDYYSRRDEYELVEVVSVTPKVVLFKDKHDMTHMRLRTQLKNAKSDYTPQRTIKPKTGLGVLFTHDTFHKGFPVALGTKYILRTDIMFERVDVLETRMRCENSPEYLLAQQLYQKSIEEQKNGNPGKSTEFYLQALDIQASLFKSHTTVYHTKEETLFPLDIFIMILATLNLSDIANFRQTCRGWNRIGRDGGVWWTRFQKEWPQVAALQSKFFAYEKLDEHHIFMKDWYGLYRRKYLFEQDVKVLAIDPGYDRIKFASEDRGSASIWSGYTSKYYHNWSAKGGITEYYVDILHGETSANNSHLRNEDACPYRGQPSVLARIVDIYVKQELSYPIDSYYLLFAKPIPMSKRHLQYTITSLFSGIEGRHVGRIHVIDAPVLSLFSFGVNTGVVISCGEKITSISVVVDDVIFKAKILSDFFFKKKDNNNNNNNDNDIVDGNDDDNDDSDDNTDKKVLPNGPFIREKCKILAEKTARIINSISNLEIRSRVSNFVLLTGGLSLHLRVDFPYFLGEKVPEANIYWPDNTCDVALGGKNYGALLHAREQFWEPSSLQYPFAQVNLEKLWPNLYYYGKTLEDEIPI